MDLHRDCYIDKLLDHAGEQSVVLLLVSWSPESEGLFIGLLHYMDCAAL